MSDALDKAEAAAAEAAVNTAAVQIALAAVELAKTAQQQAPAPAPAATPPFDARKWLTIGGLGIAGGLVASLFAVAVAIGAVSVAILALVLRGLWADFQKGK